MKKRRTFDREFKQMVIELSNNREDYTALASELDIRADLIYRWRQRSNETSSCELPRPGQ